MRTTLLAVRSEWSTDLPDRRPNWQHPQLVLEMAMFGIESDRMSDPDQSCIAHAASGSSGYTEDHG
jgi:hypothetical protein